MTDNDANRAIGIQNDNVLPLRRCPESNRSETTCDNSEYRSHSSLLFKHAPVCLWA